MFKKNVHSIISDLTEWLIVDIDASYPPRNSSKNLIASCGSLQNVPQPLCTNICYETKATFAHNHCKRVIKICMLCTLSLK